MQVIFWYHVNLLLEVDELAFQLANWSKHNYAGRINSMYSLKAFLRLPIPTIVIHGEEVLLIFGTILISDFVRVFTKISSDSNFTNLVISSC